MTNRTSDSADAIMEERSVVTDRPVPTWNDRGVEEVSRVLNWSGESAVAGERLWINSLQRLRSGLFSGTEPTEARWCL